MNRNLRTTSAGALVVMTLSAGLALWPSCGRSETTPGQKPVTVPLPEPQTDGETSVEKALSHRRSVRSYTNEPLTLAEVSQLLWSAQGITSERGFRTSPSAGALYPLELYVVAGNVTDLGSGIYRYRPAEHDLARVMDGDMREELANAALGQACLRNGAAVFVFSAVPERTTQRYGERGIRYIHMEAGHAAQNLLLQAVALDLGAVVVGAFGDDRVEQVVGMEPNEDALYLVPVGRR
jgi:SagB-type dehydrogenase family enzyme